MGKIEEYNAIRNNPSLSTAEKMKQMAAVQAKYESGSASSAGVTGGMTGASIALRGRTSTTPQMKTGKNSLRSVVKPEKTSVPITTSVIDRFIPSGFREGLKTIEGKIQSGEIKPATTVTGTMIPATPTIVTTPKTTAFAATAGAMAGIKIATTPTSKPVTSTIATTSKPPETKKPIVYSAQAFLSMTESELDLRLKEYREIDVTAQYKMSDSGKIISGEKLKKIRKQELLDYNELYMTAKGLKPYQTVKEEKGQYYFQTNYKDKANYEWEQLSDPLLGDNVFGTLEMIVMGITSGGKASSIKQYGKAFGASVLKGTYDPGFWIAAVQGEGSAYLYEKEAPMYDKLQKGDVSSFLIEDVALSPGMTNIVYPYLGGAALGAGFKTVGAAGAAAGSSTVGKVLTTYAKTAPWVAGGTASVTIGADIGLTAARQNTGDWTKDWTSPEVISKTATIGLQVGSAYLGYKTIQSYKPKWDVKYIQRSNKETLSAQKYLTNIGDRPLFHYGRKLSATRMSPRAAWDMSQAYAPKGETWWGTSDIPRLAQYSQARLDYLSYKPPMKTYTTRWGNKLFVETGKGWQPQTGKRFLPSKEVLPKPLPHSRAYQTHYFVVSYNKPLPIRIFPKSKPFHKSVKDIIKSDKTIEKTFGMGQGSKTQTILKPPKVKTVQKLKLDTIVETKTKSLVVPKSLLKPVVRYKYMGTMQKQIAKTHQFKGLKQIYQNKKVVLQKPKMATLTFSSLQKSIQQQVSSQKSKLASESIQKQLLKQSQDKEQSSLLGVIPVSASASLYGQVYAPVHAQQIASALDISKVTVPKMKQQQLSKQQNSFLLLPDPGFPKRKQIFYQYNKIGKKYKYREFKIKDILKELRSDFL